MDYLNILAMLLTLPAESAPCTAELSDAALESGRFELPAVQASPERAIRIEDPQMNGRPLSASARLTDGRLVITASTSTPGDFSAWMIAADGVLELSATLEESITADCVQGRKLRYRWLADPLESPLRVRTGPKPQICGASYESFALAQSDTGILDAGAPDTVRAVHNSIGETVLVLVDQTWYRAPVEAVGRCPSDPLEPEDRTELCKGVEDGRGDTSGRVHVCIDATGSDIEVKRPTSVIRANTEVEVTLYAIEGVPWTVALGGERGSVPLDANRNRNIGASDGGRTRRRSFLFTPRQPGKADLRVVRTDSGDSWTIEFEVEAIYWGAIRFGLGTVFGDAVHKRYRTVSQSAGTALEVRLEDDRGFEVELVLGVSPYLFDVLAFGGRSYRSHNLRIAPYIGFGLASETPSGVEALGSVHLGLEFEFAPAVSLAATAVLRSVEVLDDGVALGSLVEPNAPFTRGSDRWGFGLVLNVSPGFLTFESPFPG